jgi:hypothetical protein
MLELMFEYERSGLLLSRQMQFWVLLQPSFTPFRCRAYVSHLLTFTDFEGFRENNTEPLIKQYLSHFREFDHVHPNKPNQRMSIGTWTDNISLRSRINLLDENLSEENLKELDAKAHPGHPLLEC